MSSNRVSLLDPNSRAAPPPICDANHIPATDSSEGFAATQWASELFLRRLTDLNEADWQNAFFGED